MTLAEVKSLPFFKGFKHRKKSAVFQYILLVYDLESDISNERDLEERKKIALERTKLPKEEDWVQEIVKCTHPEVSILIDYFLGYQMNDEWSFLIAQRELHHALMKEIREPGGKTKDRTVASQNAEAVMSRIKRMELEIYGGEAEIQNGKNQLRKTKLEQFVADNRT